MKNNNVITEEDDKEEHEQEQEVKKRLEIIKAVAQARLSHSDSWSSKHATSEFEAQRRCNYIKGKPSRFKLEVSSIDHQPPSSSRWDFGQSLWDSHEIVAVSKKLERGLALENTFWGVAGDYDFGRLMLPKKRESRNSLRNLFNRVRSRRFKESHIPLDN